MQNSPNRFPGYAKAIPLVLAIGMIVGWQQAGWGQTAMGPIDKDAPQEFTKTDSGLKYRILRKTDGKKPTARDKVTVHYKGWLPDRVDPSEGKEFDSSYRRGEPISFPLSGVIKGWTEGMQLVGTGGMIELEIPPNLGYGARGAGGAIPPNATLRFIVELIAINGAE